MFSSERCLGLFGAAIELTAASGVGLLNDPMGVHKQVIRRPHSFHIPSEVRAVVVGGWVRESGESVSSGSKVSSPLGVLVLTAAKLLLKGWPALHL